MMFPETSAQSLVVNGTQDERGITGMAAEKPALRKDRSELAPLMYGDNVPDGKWWRI